MRENCHPTDARLHSFTQHRNIIWLASINWCGLCGTVGGPLLSQGRVLHASDVPSALSECNKIHFITPLNLNNHPVIYCFYNLIFWDLQTNKCVMLEAMLVVMNKQRIITRICSSPWIYRAALKLISAHCLAVQPSS